jgi:hypothetical protein
MSIVNNIRTYFSGGKLIAKAKCGGFGCGKVFELTKPLNALPDILICPECEERFNRGITQWVHANSGRVGGNFHILDGYSKE